MAISFKDSYNLNMVKKIAILALFGLFLSNSAFAQFGFHAGSHFGYGKLRNDTGSVPDRGIGTFDLQLMHGYRFIPDLLAGLMLNYRFMSQFADERDVGGTDFSGRGFLLGLGASYEPGPLKFLLSWDIRARHWFSGPETTYMGSGFSLLFGYEFEPSWHLDLIYQSTTYDAVEINGAKTRLDSNKVSHWNMGFGVSYSY